MTGSRRTALVVLTVAQLAIGAAAIFARYALAGTGPITVSAFRLAIAAAVAIAIALLWRGNAPVRSRDEGRLALAGVFLALHFALWIGSLDYLSVAISTLLVTTTPLWLGLYDMLVARRRVAPAFWLGLVFAAAGVALVARSHGSPAPRAGHELLGIALALGGSFAIGAYLLVVRDVGVRAGTRPLVARTYGWAAAVLLAALPFAHESLPSTPGSWGGIVAMALVSQALGHTALNVAVRSFTPRLVATTTLAEPIIAALFAALLFGERLGWEQATGGACILIAIALALRSEEPATGPADDPALAAP